MSATPPCLYLEFPARDELRQWVDCLWASGDAQVGAGAAYPILPDGCVDIVLRFRRQRSNPNGRCVESSLEEVTVVGPMTRALWLAPSPAEEWLGVRFRPGRAYPFVKVPLSGLVDRRPAARDVLEARVAERLESIRRERAIVDSLRVLEGIVLNLNPGRHASSAPASGGVRAIEAVGGQLRIERLCSEIGISRQHLSREFARHVGLSPKALCRIVRFRRALRRARASEEPNWADIAAEVGYYDQAHLIADFVEFSGTTPGRYRRAPFRQPAASPSGPA